MNLRTVKTWLRLGLFGALCAIVALPASAQRYERDSRFGSRSENRNVAGEFAYYALVLSWSPTHCSSARPSDGDPQCSRKDGRRYGFILHGLWPQHEKGWPEYCPGKGRTYIPQDVLDDLGDMMPSPRLAIHEYRKHGTCTGLSPAEYFTLSRKLYQKIRVPDAYVNPFESRTVATDDFVDDFLAVNPGLKPDMLAVSCGGPGHRLREIRVCFDRGGNYRACGLNEDQRRMCSANRVFVPPVRSTKAGSDTSTARQPRDLRAPLPMPKMPLPR
jgi:ribonuclease T2